MEKENTLESLAYFLIDEADQLGERDLRDKAAEILGMSEIICYKIKSDMELWQDELDYIVEELTKKSNK